MNAITMARESALNLPTIRSADWFMRIPLAIILFGQGTNKLGENFYSDANMYGIPSFAYGLASFAEIAAAFALIAGGLLRNNWAADLLTRLGGLATSIVVAGVIYLVYFGPFYAWHLQGLLLAGGLFFLFRGNGDVKDRTII